MHRNCWLVALTALLGMSALSAATVQFETIDLPDVAPGQDLREYIYTISGIVFAANQEIDIRFDPLVYGALSNGKAGPGFDVVLFSPNNPTGAQGDYTAEALVNGPALTGPFSVDFVFLGTGQPGSQPFFIYQLDSVGNITGTITSGFTSPATVTGVPEPQASTLCALGMGMVLIFAGMRRGRIVGAGLARCSWTAARHRAHVTFR